MTDAVVQDIGLTAKLVSFAGATDVANRAALAFRAAVEAADWPGVAETSSTLASAYVRFDPLVLSHDAIEARLHELLAQTDWGAQPLPQGRRLWQIPVVLGGAHGPQFAEAAALAGLTEAQAAEQILDARVRVLTLGFAPGQPYLGELPPQWDIPRMTTLNPQVPAHSLVVAIRQLIIFTGPAPTGWRHIGQTGFHNMQGGGFAFRPGDEVTFRAVLPDDLKEFGPDGGATVEALT